MYIITLIVKIILLNFFLFLQKYRKHILLCNTHTQVLIKSLCYLMKIILLRNL